MYSTEGGAGIADMLKNYWWAVVIALLAVAFIWCMLGKFPGEKAGMIPWQGASIAGVPTDNLVVNLGPYPMIPPKSKGNYYGTETGCKAPFSGSKEGLVYASPSNITCNPRPWSRDAVGEAVAFRAMGSLPLELGSSNPSSIAGWSMDDPQWATATDMGKVMQQRIDARQAKNIWAGNS